MESLEVRGICLAEFDGQAFYVLAFALPRADSKKVLTGVTGVTYRLCDACNTLPMKRSIRITAAEWEVMTVVWERAPIAARAIVHLLKEKKQWALATVRTLLRRLVNKGALEQRQEGKRYVYTPRVSREECVHWESESFLDRVLGRAPSATILHLVKKADLSKLDIQELRRILREKEKET